MVLLKWVPGGQAELLRVPFADFNCLVLPLMRQKKKMIM